MPRAWGRKPVFAVPHHSAAASIFRRGIPVTSSAQARSYPFTASAASAKPEVWFAMKSWSSWSRSTSCLSIAPKRAESRPGRTGRWRSAVRASGVTRGSTTISFAPLSRACQIQCVSVGNVSLTFAPATRITSAFARSAYVLLARSSPKAFLFPAPALTMQSRPL